MQRWDLLLTALLPSQIRRLLAPRDLDSLALTCTWLLATRRHNAVRPCCSPAQDFPTQEQCEWLATEIHTAMTREFYAKQTRSKANRRKTRLTFAQVVVFVDQLWLVSSGIRAACLIDHCSVGIELAAFMLRAANESGSLCSNAVVGVIFSGNLFLIHKATFVSNKLLQVASEFRELVVVNSSAQLRSPELIAIDGEEEPSVKDELSAVVTNLCFKLKRLEPTDRVVEWTPRSRLSSAAIAGLVLSYPAIYDLCDDQVSIDDSEWRVQENCLAMCPLVVVQTALSNNGEPELPLQEFSVPQHLLRQEHFAVLKAATRLQLEHALHGSGFARDPLRLHLRVATRTLPRVAL